MDERTMRFLPIEIQLSSTSFSAVPGSTITVPFRIINRSGRDDFFEVSLRGIPVTWQLIDMPVLQLADGEQRETSIGIMPPAGMAGSSGSTPVTIQVASQADPSEYGEAQFNLMVGDDVAATQVAGPTRVADGTRVMGVSASSGPTEVSEPESIFSSDLSPRRVDAGQTARLRIHNFGRAPATFSIQWQTLGDELEFVAERSGPIYVQPGDTVAVDFAVSPRSPNWLSSPTAIPYTVIVRSADGEAQAHNGEVISRALIPVWVLPALLVLCLTAICGVGFLWNWNQGRLTAATATVGVAMNMTEAVTATIMAQQTAAALAGQEDTDGDGLTNAQEEQLGTNPQLLDSDNDRLSDGDEVQRGSNPLNPDSDGDGILDGLDINPLDANNPALTETAVALQPTVTATVEPSATVPTPTTVPPTLTVTLTSTPAPPTPTQAPLPITGDSAVVFESNLEGSSNLYLLAAPDGDISRLTEGDGPNTQAAWSPEGNRVVFTSGRDGNNEIYVMNADGSDLTNLTNNPADDSFPAWSPDGNAVVFTSNRDGNNEIYRIDADGDSPVNLTNNPSNDSAPVWYRAGGLLASDEGILFTTNRDGNNEIYVMKPDGSEPENLTRSPANDSFAHIRFEGGPVSFVTDRDGNLEVYRMNLDGGAVTNLTNHSGSDTLPAWSPDGSQIAFVTDRDGNAEIYVMGASGEDPANLTRSAAQELYPAWR